MDKNLWECADGLLVEMMEWASSSESVGPINFSSNLLSYTLNSPIEARVLRSKIGACLYWSHFAWNFHVLLNKEETLKVFHFTWCNKLQSTSLKVYEVEWHCFSAYFFVILKGFLLISAISHTWKGCASIRGPDNIKNKIGACFYWKRASIGEFRVSRPV